MGILIEKTGNDGVEMIYGVTNERRGLPVINPWFEIDSHSIPDFYYTREDGISLFYRKSGIWHSIRIGADGRIVKTDILTDLKENSKILSVGGMAIPEVYFIGADDDVYGHAQDTGRFRLTKYLFRKSGSEWVFGQKIPVPADIETTDYVKSGWVNKCMFLVFNTGEGLALFRIEG
jgi:hypothetical protein